MTKKFTVTGFFYRQAKRYWVRFLLLIVSVIGIAVSSIMPSLVLKRIVDGMVSFGNGGIDASVLGMWTALYFLGYFFLYFFTIMENFLVDDLGQKMIHALRYEMIEKSHHLKSDYYRHTGTGVMTSRIMDDVLSIENLFTDGLISLIVSLLKIFSVLVSVFVFSWVLGLIALVCVPLVYVLTHFFRKALLKHQLSSRKISNLETNQVSESIDNIEVLQNLEKKAYRESKFTNLLKQERTEKKKAAYFDSTFSPIVMSLRAIVIALVTYLVARSLSDSTMIAGLSTGTFAASITLISNLFSPIQDMGQEIQTMQEGISGIKRTQDFMNLEEEKEKDTTIQAEKVLTNLQDDLIRFEDLSFHYPDGTDLIYDKANLVIHKDAKVSLMGRTGAGKTTLFYLMLSLLSPTEGRVLINGYDASMIPNDQKRKIFGYVPQGFEPIQGTVMDQVTLKDSSISLERVREVMRVVFLDDYVIEKNKDGYLAKFREEDFSRGQLQLLSLARALLFDPPILLLDEISANLDSRTEQALLTALEKVGTKKTMITISHRLSDQLGFSSVVEVRDLKLYPRS